MSFGERIKERRTALGLSQEKVAQKADLSWAAIQRLEAGKITDPHYSTLSAVAQALGTTVAELAGEEELAVRKVSAPPETGRPEDPWREVAREALGIDVEEVSVSSVPEERELLLKALQDLLQENERLRTIVAELLKAKLLKERSVQDKRARRTKIEVPRVKIKVPRVKKQRDDQKANSQT
jgi:transcriptional regulator with XRE-family HTH domain